MYLYTIVISMTTKINHYPTIQWQSVIFLQILEEHESKQPQTHAKTKEEINYQIDQLAETVDHAMKAYDENDDGYIFYGEFYRYDTFFG